jgi:hypothetical protein
LPATLLYGLEQGSGLEAGFCPRVHNLCFVIAHLMLLAYGNNFKKQACPG